MKTIEMKNKKAAKIYYEGTSENLVNYLQAHTTLIPAKVWANAYGLKTFRYGTQLLFNVVKSTKNSKALVNTYKVFYKGSSLTIKVRYNLYTNCKNTGLVHYDCTKHCGHIKQFNGQEIEFYSIDLFIE